MVTIGHRGVPPVGIRPFRAEVLSPVQPDLRSDILSVSPRPMARDVGTPPNASGCHSEARGWDVARWHPVEALTGSLGVPTGLVIAAIRNAKTLKPKVKRMKEKIMRKVLRGYAKGKDGDLILIGTIPVPYSKDKPSPRERKDKRHLVTQGATIFKKEMIW